MFGELPADVLERLAADMEQLELTEGSTLVREGDSGDDVFAIVSGRLLVKIRGENGDAVVVGELGASEIVGEVPLVAGGTRSATVIAAEESLVYRLPGETLRRMENQVTPAIVRLTELARHRIYRAQLGAVLAPILGPLPTAVVEALAAKLSWVQLKRGEVLFSQGDAADAWYVVVHGRLQVVTADRRARSGQGSVLLGDVFRGESVAETAILTGGVRTASVIAARDTELICFSSEDFLEVLQTHPAAWMSVSRLLARRLSRGSSPKPDENTKRGALHIAVVPGSGESTIAPWVTSQLVRSLSRWGQTLHLSPTLLTEQGVIRDSGTLPSDHPAWARFATWFHQQAESATFVVLQAVPGAPAWLERVLGNADHTVVVCDAASDPIPSAMEKRAWAEKARPLGGKRVLALVHPKGTSRPTGTRKWLVHRSVDLHVHMHAQNTRDVDRLARLLSGRAVGVALGGGGARGLAHIGVLRALEEARIPIDFVGGTSMGAVIGAQYSMGYTYREMLKLNWQVIERRPFKDYTLPMIALLGSKRLDEVAKLAFGDTEIEDLWINFFAVSSDLRHADVVVHDQGLLWKATRASGALPGIVAPVEDGSRLLVDGGLLNNLPGDIVRARCGGSVIAVEVRSEFDLSTPLEGIPSPWKLFWNRISPFSKRIAAPTLFEILTRATSLSSTRAETRVQRQADLCIEPEIDRFGLLDFDRMHEIVETGYRAGIGQAEQWNGLRLRDDALHDERARSIPPIAAAPTPDDDLPGVAPGKGSLVGELLTPMLLLQGATTGRRSTHIAGVGATGRFVVSEGVDRPTHDFFVIGREFPLVVRFSTVTWRDQAAMDVRGIAMRLASMGSPSPFDMGLNTGVISAADSVATFAALILSKWFPTKVIDMKMASSWRNRETAMVSLRRAPECFSTLRYHSQTVRHWIDLSGIVYLVRYRVTPLDVDAAETGVPNARDYKDLLRSRRPEETLPVDYLTERFIGRLQTGQPLRLRFQAQFHRKQEHESPEWYNSTVEWPEDVLPWRDIGMLILDRALDHETTEWLEFSTANHPASLPVPKATSVTDYRSLADAEQKAVAIAQRARRLTYRLRGIPLPVAQVKIPAGRP